jgi:hypothetical protein
VWKSTFANLDIRQWLPGDKFNYDPINATFGTHAYAVPAVKYRATGTFTVPASMPAGEYVLALAILDPAGMLPCARFAITNYWTGGRHPIGKIGVGASVANPQLTAFDDLQADNSLHYVYGGPTGIGAKDNKVSGTQKAPAVSMSAGIVRISIASAGNYEAKITGIDGRLVSEVKGVAPFAGHQAALRAQVPGMYMLQVKTMAGGAVTRLVVRNEQ